MYNPSDHFPLNISFGITDLPLNAKSLFFDTSHLIFRPFISANECSGYFAAEFKDPTFECIVNEGGTLNANGTITGGQNTAYWFRDGVNLEKKGDAYTKTEINQFLAAVNLAITNHVNDLTNPHQVTKAQVGLGNVANLLPADMPISTATQTALNNKVDKSVSKQLSDENFTTAEKAKLAQQTGVNTGDQDLSSYATTSYVTTGLSGKVDKVTGKDLSTNDYDNTEKAQVATNKTDVATIKDVNGLTSATISPALLLAIYNTSNVRFKMTVQEFINYVTPIITALGSSGFVAQTGTVLPASNGTPRYTVVAGPATFTRSGMTSVVTTEKLNILIDNGTVWTLAYGIPVLEGSQNIPLTPGNTVLPNQTSIKNGFSLASGPATYTQTTGGNITTLDGISVLNWNGTTFSLGVNIPVNTAAVTTIQTILGITAATEKIGYDTYTTPTTTSTFGLYVHKNKTVLRPGKAVKLTYMSNITDLFFLVHLRLSGNNYIEVNRYSVTPTAGNTKLTLDLTSLNINCLVGDTFGYYSVNTNGRIRSCDLTGAGYFYVAGSTGWTITKANITNGSVADKALTYDVDVLETTYSTRLDANDANINANTASIASNTAGIAVLNDIVLPKYYEEDLGYNQLTPTTTTAVFGLFLHAGNKVISGNGKAYKLRVVMNGTQAASLVHLRPSGSNFVEQSRVAFSAPAGLTLYELDIDFTVQKGDTFAIEAPLANGRLRYTASTGSGFSVKSAQPIPVSYSVVATDVDKALSFDILCSLKVETASTASTLSDSPRYGTSELGAIDFQGFLTQLSQFIIYGQSLSLGWQSYIALTTASIPGIYSVGDSVHISDSNDGTKILKPLVNKIIGNGRECALVPALHSFKNVFDKLNNRGGQVEFIGTSCGSDGKSIAELSKGNASGLYTSLFTKTLDDTVTAATAASKTLSCQAIVYMQGEQDYSNNTTKAAYKTALLTLKNNMQADIIAKYGQANRPLFFIYQTSGVYITYGDVANSESNRIAQGQYEFAQENEDVILLNPHYAMSKYTTQGHLAANGYRHFGELMGKTFNQVFNKGLRFSPIVPKNFKVSGKTVTIDFYVPVSPLLFDNYTNDQQVYNGFNIIQGGNQLAIDTAIFGNSVVLTASISLTGTFAVSYAGYRTNGSGNLRDSDGWRSKYLYVDDSANPSIGATIRYVQKDKSGANLYGKPYPCYNWAAAFYQEFTL